MIGLLGGSYSFQNETKQTTQQQQKHVKVFWPPTNERWGKLHWHCGLTCKLVAGEDHSFSDTKRQLSVTVCLGFLWGIRLRVVLNLLKMAAWRVRAWGVQTPSCANMCHRFIGTLLAWGLGELTSPHLGALTGACNSNTFEQNKRMGSHAATLLLRTLSER